MCEMGDSLKGNTTLTDGVATMRYYCLSIAGERGRLLMDLTSFQIVTKGGGSEGGDSVQESCFLMEGQLPIFSRI